MIARLMRLMLLLALLVLLAACGGEEETEEPTEAPATEVAETDEPTEEMVVTDEPTEEMAVTDEPTEEMAVTDEPTEEIAVTDEPTEEMAVTDEPTEEMAVTDEPIEEMAVTDEPTEEMAVTDEPTEEMAVTDEPTEEMAVTDEPTEEMVVTDEPTEEMAVTDEPTEEVTAEDGTIVEVTTLTEGFTTLVAAIEAADLADALNDEDSTFTVFAPTDDAFAALLDALGMTADELLAETDLLTDILLYHVVEGEVLEADVVELDGESVPTLLEDAEITVEVTDDGVQLNNRALIIGTDTLASNGVIHVIDNVLLPETIMEPMAADEPTEEPTEEPEATGGEDVATLGVGFIQIEGEPLEVLVVDENSAAAEAGIERGDTILSIDGEDITSDQLGAALADYAPGDAITVTIERDGETEELEITLGAEADLQGVEIIQQEFMGVLMVADPEGALLIEVLPDSPAAEASLEVGDLITEVGGEALDSRDAIVELLRNQPPGEELALTVESDDETDVTLVTPMMPIAWGGGPAGLQPELVFDEITFDEENENWILVDLAENGALESLGFEDGDVITAINGAVIRPEDASTLFQTVRPEDEFVYTVERGDEELEITGPGSSIIALVATTFGPGAGAPFGQAPPATLQPVPGQESPPMSAQGRIAASVVEVTESLAEENNLEVTDGFLVLLVEEGSNTAESGLQVGDVILEIEGVSVTDEDPIAELMLSYMPGDVVTLTIERNGEIEELELTLDAADTNLAPEPFPGGGIGPGGADRPPQVPGLPGGGGPPTPTDGPPSS